MALRTNYKDDIFSGNRKYTQINNGDGTISFTDQTDYSQVGDSFGATQINEIDGKINSHDSSISTINSSISSLNSSVSTLNNELTYSGTKFYFDNKNGKWGWNSSSARGADTFHPFSQIEQIYVEYIVANGRQNNSTYAAEMQLDISKVNRLSIWRYSTNSAQYGLRPAWIALSANGSTWNNIWVSPQNATDIDIGVYDVTTSNWVKFYVEAFGQGTSSGFWRIRGYNVV